MLETLNILEGYDLRSMGFNSADYIHTVTEALKLAYADRDTYYGDPKFNHIPEETLLSKAYAAERRKEIGHMASMDFLPGIINGKRGRHPTEMDIARTKIDDALMASDTTCVDAIDKDGIVFSATPSGAWLPVGGCRRHRHSAHRARPAIHPGSRIAQRTRRRQAPARNFEPHHRHRAGQAVPGAVHSRRRQPGTKPDPIVL